MTESKDLMAALLETLKDRSIAAPSAVVPTGIHHPCVPGIKFCSECNSLWPCNTAEALGVTE